MLVLSEAEVAGLELVEASAVEDAAGVAVLPEPFDALADDADILKAWYATYIRVTRRSRPGVNEHVIISTCNYMYCVAKGKQKTGQQRPSSTMDQGARD